MLIAETSAHAKLREINECSASTLRPFLHTHVNKLPLLTPGRHPILPPGGGFQGGAFGPRPPGLAPERVARKGKAGGSAFSIFRIWAAERIRA